METIIMYRDSTGVILGAGFWGVYVWCLGFGGSGVGRLGFRDSGCAAIEGLGCRGWGVGVWGLEIQGVRF